MQAGKKQLRLSPRVVLSPWCEGIRRGGTQPLVWPSVGNRAGRNVKIQFSSGLSHDFDIPEKGEASTSAATVTCQMFQTCLLVFVNPARATKRRRPPFWRSTIQTPWYSW